jgi:chromosome segregation and condensation protein ScpB
VTPTAAAAQDKPVTVKQVAKNVGKETKRVSKRSAKAVKKGYKDTEKQTRRTANHLHRSVSPEERERQAAGNPR